MPQKINLKFKRLELKYVISQELGEEIISKIKNYVILDNYANIKNFYEVHSIYFDSAQKHCYHAKINGITNRKKLRMRIYKEEAQKKQDIFLEIKRKNNNVILKDRIILEKEDLKCLLNNPFTLLQYKKYPKEFLNEFLFDFVGKKMKPAVQVIYKRKPYFLKSDKNFRITLDYDLCTAQSTKLSFEENTKKSRLKTVIFEVKFYGIMPQWFYNIINKYQLTKVPFSKYCKAIETEYGLPSYF